jgi:hypothetical protein
MGIWWERWEQYKAKVDLDQISTARKMFFKTNPSDTQILYLDMVQSRNNAAWVVTSLFMLMMGTVIGGFFYWIIQNVH